MPKKKLDHNFTLDAVRSFKDERGSAFNAQISPLARQIATQYRHDTMSPVMVIGVVRILEFSLLVLSGIGLWLAYVGWEPGQLWYYGPLILACSATSVVLLEIAGNYQLARLQQPLLAFGTCLLVWTSALAAMAAIGFFLKISIEFSRVWAASWFAAGLIGMLAFRSIVARLVRRWARNGRMERRAVIIGGGSQAEALIRSIERQPFNDIRICGFFDDRDDTRSPPIIAGYPKLGSVAQLIEFARIARIDMLIVSLPFTAEKRVLSLLKKLWVLPVDIRLSAHSNQLRFRPRSYSFIGSVPMLDIFDRPINDWDSVVKRSCDVVFSLLGIVLFAPVMLATAVAIKLDSKGPILFKQTRHGFNNEPIDVYKFRSMYVEQCDPSAKNAVTKNDPRVTRVGRFIRKTSIDELPQFFNVLMGHLSLVGPRPHAVAGQTRNLLYHEVVDGYFARHRVKPGVTGWAQVNGWRGEIDNDEKIRIRTEFDLYYIENWSLWLDLKILFLTPIRLLNSENAY